MRRQQRRLLAPVPGPAGRVAVGVVVVVQGVAVDGVVGLVDDDDDAAAAGGRRWRRRRGRDPPEPRPPMRLPDPLRAGAGQPHVHRAQVVPALQPEELHQPTAARPARQSRRHPAHPRPQTGND